jgi:hypothetical protein
VPVQKYRDISEVPRPALAENATLTARISALWERANLLSPTRVVRGVQRFRSIEAAYAARQRATLENMRRASARREPALR